MQPGTGEEDEHEEEAARLTVNLGMRRLPAWPGIPLASGWHLWYQGTMVDREIQVESGPESRDCFSTTHWSVVLAAGEAGTPQAREALEVLCRTYWPPLYAFVRRQGHDATESEDLIQEFFARLLRREFPGGVQREGGRFRSYLLTSLRRFLTNEWQRARTQKRGGGVRVMSWEALRAEDRYGPEPCDPVTPEMLYDRRWALVLLERVRGQLGAEQFEEGRGEVFEVLQPCLTGAERLIPYAALARQLGVTESAIKMTVHRLRKRFGELLRREIRQTVDRPEAVEDEIRSLLESFQGA
jgi:RNA polymerase sigma factor (sigma-70 family)